jgi:protocatechuate 3,4-dioxygenase, alpha subunit
MAQPLNRLKESPSQTAGPYIHIGATPNVSGIEGIYAEDLGKALVNAKTKGARVTLTGRVIDGTGTPLKDALVEIWQADADGRYPGRGEHRGPADPNFSGWGRQAVDAETGVYRFETIKPGRVPFPDGRPMAPHVTFWIFARGINLGLQTRLYFGDETAANEADPVLARIEHRNRVPTLIAPVSMVGGTATYTFDIHLQGASETVFFDV